MRVSRLSLGGPAQEEPIQLDGAFLPPLSARTSFVSERRASAPVNALPHIPEEPPVPPTTGATPGMVFSKRRSSAHPSLGGSGRSSISLQPNTPQRLHEASRRSSLSPTTFQDPLQQHFDEALPANPDSFEPAAFSPAYGVRGEEGSLRRVEDSFTFSTDAPHQKLREAAHMHEAVPDPGSFTEKFAQMPVQRVSKLSEEAAEQLLHSAALQTNQGGESGGQEAQKMAMNRDALEVVIMHAVQASMTSVFVSLATDVQQLDAKFGAWSQRSEEACAGLQSQLSQLRRGTANDISAIGVRLESLEAHKKVPTMQPEDKESQEPPVPLGSGWDEHFTMDLIERLDALETRVASQLDQLTSVHEERITAIKGNLHASVAEAAAAAGSRPASPIKHSAGTAAFEKLASTTR
ncbi:hypothetical protein WJX75_006259 [Coccomyxa subellipsoidea]|uniref:Uncharacterized protein n=1 Tax=Coccomyxa subellipsoidea TaxID=248742 RepID=A0ABR2YVN6_9CHLO